MNYRLLNEVLIEWNESFKEDSDNTFIEVAPNELDPESLKLKVWMAAYRIPKQEKKKAKEIKRKYWDNDILFPKNQWDPACTGFEAFAMIASRLNTAYSPPVYPALIKATTSDELELDDYTWTEGPIGDYCIEKASKDYYTDFVIIFNWIKSYNIDEETIWSGWRVLEILTNRPELIPEYEKTKTDDFLDKYYE